MNWKILLFSAIIVLLYVPLTLIGTNTFFPEYADYDSGCYNRYPSVAVPVAKDGTQSATDMAAAQKMDAERAACEKAYQNAKRDYDGTKYIVIMVLNVVILLLVLLVTFNDSIRYGLFTGVAVSGFFAVLIYQDTRSKLGFVFLLALFALVVWFINREKDLWIKRGAKKGSR